MTQLTCTWTGAHLSPADDATRKAVARLAVGDQVTWTAKKVRNGKHHRMRFQWVKELYQFLEHLNIFTGSEHLRELLTLNTDIGCKLVKNPLTGEVTKHPLSWSYEAIDEVKFSMMARQIVAYLLSDFMPQAIVLGNWDGATISRFEQIVIFEA